MLADGVLIDGCASEGGVTDMLLNGNSVSGTGIAGLRITNNRAEALTEAFLLMLYLTTNSNYPTFMSGNFILLGSGVPTVLQHNVGGLNVTINTPVLTTV